MEEKINIAEILKDKPQGIRLYSPIFGECAFCYVREDTEDICVKKHNGEKAYFNSEGLYNALGEVMLFPSKEGRDWLKFTWKKGDVFQHSEYPLTVIFESFEDDTYTSFKCKYCFNFESASKWLVSNSQCSTKHFYKVSEEEAKEFIKKVELNYNGKLKMETLEIEPAQPEFKDGDILLYKSAKFTFFSSIFILCTNRNKMCSYVRFSIGKGSIDYDVPVCSLNTDRFRYATEEEKLQLFDALAKKGKQWDAKKKMIVDLKQKVELKPFDKVLVRDSKSDNWRANLFSHIEKDGYYHCVSANWIYCIPYIGNESLLGTTKDVEG